MSPTEIIAAGLRAKQEADAAVENQEQQFTIDQFQSVVQSVQDANKLLVSFLLKWQPDVAVKNFPDFPKTIATPDVANVVKAVKGLETTLKPATVDNSGIIKAVAELIKGQKVCNDLLSRLDLKPQVSVAAPIVNVEKPDLAKLEKAIAANKPESVDLSPVVKGLAANLTATKAVSNTLMKLKFPVATVPTDPLINYLSADVDDAGTVQYYGNTDNRGAWYIRKYDTSVSPKTIRLCFGQANYATNWTNRASLTYVIWGS